MASIDLQYVDELLQARRALHGGGQGAPPIVNGARQGTALNRSCVLMISALLQGYVEEVFFEVSEEKLGLSAAQVADYRRLYDRFGNPSPQNIRTHFRRLGVPDVLAGLSWQARTIFDTGKEIIPLSRCSGNDRLPYVVCDRTSFCH